MGFLGIWGFESRNVFRDGFTILGGTPSYPTDVPVGGSTRSFTNGNVVTTLQAIDFFTASASEFWLVYRIKPRANNGVNDSNHIGWRKGGVLRGYITLQDSTLRPQIYVGGVLQATAPSAVNFNAWNQLHVHVNINTIGGFVRIYTGGDIQPGNHVAEFLGDTDPGVDSTMDELYLKLTGGGGNVPYIDDLLIMNPNDGTGTTDINELTSPGVFPSYPVSDSGTHTAWTQQGAPGGAADYEFIDEVQPADGDFIRATAVNQKSTFGFTAGPGGKVLGARIKARALRGDAAAGVNIRTISRQGGVDYLGATQACPGDGDIDEIYNLAPDSTAWDTAKFDAVEWGVESVT